MEAVKDCVLFTVCLQQLEKLEVELKERIKRPIYNEEAEAYKKIAETLFEMLSAAAVMQRINGRSLKEAVTVRSNIEEMLDWNVTSQNQTGFVKQGSIVENHN